MNKAELIALVAKKADLSKAQVAATLDAFADSVSASLAEGDKVTWAGFGTFSVIERAARMGRNPQTGEPIEIKASKAPKFKAGKDLKDRLA